MTDPSFRLLSLPLKKLRTDGDTNARAELNQLAVAEYTETARRWKEAKVGCQFPPGVAFWDVPARSYWLAGGFHRHEALGRAGYTEMLVKVYEGTRRDAVFYSAGDNKLHGVRLSNQDKHRAVLILLCDPEWEQWSNPKIADHCGVSHEFVRKVREALSSHRCKMRDQDTRRQERKVERNGTTYTMDTSKIGRYTAGSAPPPPPPRFEDLTAKEKLEAIQAEKKRVARDYAKMQVRDHVEALRKLAGQLGQAGAVRHLEAFCKAVGAG